MIQSSVCPPWQPDLTGQARRRARFQRSFYTTPWDTIFFAATIVVGAVIWMAIRFLKKQEVSGLEATVKSGEATIRLLDKELEIARTQIAGLRKIVEERGVDPGLALLQSSPESTRAAFEKVVSERVVRFNRSDVEAMANTASLSSSDILQLSFPTPDEAEATATPVTVRLSGLYLAGGGLQLSFGRPSDTTDKPQLGKS